jgi:4-hydroxybenzoate polyprenyltransferase
VIASDIKLAHSVFAMPFALLAAFMAANSEPEKTVSGTVFCLALIVTAMVLARTVAMLANRLLDRDIDQSNPRTAGRAIPSGRLRPRTALFGLLLCAAAFLANCAAFALLDANWWPLRLGPFVLLWISAYPLLKRFTILCHIYLGSSLAISPIAAAIAINPHSITQQPALWLLAGMVLCWVAGFDIIYALQDVDVDRAQNLHSIPARLGVPRALWIARTLHALAVACLIASLFIDPRFGVLFAIGIALVAALMIYEHLTVARWGTSKIALTFFTLNGLISCVLGTLGIIDILL